MQAVSAGIDIGTTHAKAVLLAANGTVVAQFRTAYQPRQERPGYHELDANEVLTAVTGVLQQCFAAQTGCIITVVCFSAAMHGLMAVDKNGDPLTGVMTWADTRSKHEAAELQKSGMAEKIYNRTGTPVHPMSPLCKLVWLKKNEPDVFRKAFQYISFKEYVLYRLTGHYFTDHSIAAATGLFDLHTFTWNKEALAIAGIGEEQLPALYPVDHAVMDILPEYRNSLGITNKVPFILGGSDGAMANIGSNAMEAGIASLTIGTSAAIRMVVPRATLDAKQRLFCYAIDQQHYICGGPLNNGGAVAKWFVENVLQQNPLSQEEYAALVAQAFKSDRPSGLIFVPHLMGERAIHWDAFAKAAFIGLTPAHTGKEMLLAVFEGISFALYEILCAMEESGMAIHTIVAGGGFTASADWLQLVADIFNKEIKVTDDADASARGAAMLGFRSTGQSLFTAKEEAATIYYPHKEKHALYLQYFRIYTSLYPSLKTSFDALDRLQEKA